MKYSEFIQNIISSRGQWSEEVRNSNRGCEKHHIVPKCMGGLPKYPTWKKHSNIIWLYPQEHFIAHQLLVEENPTNIKLLRSFILMSVGRNNKLSLTAEDYENLKLAAKYVAQMDNPAKRIEVRTKISIAAKKRKLSADTKLKIGLAQKGKVTSVEVKEKISVANKGKHNHKTSESTKYKMSKAHKGKKHSATHKNNISKALTGRKLSAEHKDNLKKALINNPKRCGENNPRATAVLCIETGQVFMTIKQACEWANSSKVGEVIKGNRKTAGGYHWKAIKETKKQV